MFTSILIVVWPFILGGSVGWYLIRDARADRARLAKMASDVYTRHMIEARL